MASHRFDDASRSSDEEEEIFPGFTLEEVAEIRQERQRRQQENSLRDVDWEIEEIFDFGEHEGGTNSDVEIFGNEEEEQDDEEESDDKDMPSVGVQWSNTSSEIDIEEFTIPHGPSKDLGEGATPKDFFNLFIDDGYLDEVVRCTVAYARSKGDATFVTTRAEISAYLGLNILMGIHRLPHVDMFWDSDEFISVEGFKKTIPKQRFKTLSKFLHLIDPREEDPTDVLCKVRSLVALLERRFMEAFIPGKNISIDEGLVKFNGRLSFKQYMRSY